MDVRSVGAQYAEMMKLQEKTLLEAKKRKGERPCDRKSREHTYNKFMVHLLATGFAEDRHQVHSSFVPPAYPPCTTPVDELRHIAINQLQLETHHRGTYLLLRSITPPNRMTAIMAVMEDENSDVMMVQLYQQEDEGNRAAVDIVNVGTILLIKEPYFKVMGDGEYGLRVDHLSDVIHIKEDDAGSPKAWQPRLVEIGNSVESLKAKGNLSMEKSRYWDAIAEYSDALDCPATADQIDVIKRNRSLAFLKNKQFDAGLADSGFPNFNRNPNEKALYRAAEALYGLENFGQCCQVLELLCTNFPHNTEASKSLVRAQSRSLEQKTGAYDFKLLQAKAKKLRPPHLDHATYIGPVEIRQTESKGRGLFVTKAVKAGDLLLCEKAFSHAYAGEGADAGNKSSSKISILLNPGSKQGFMGTQADLIKLIVQKLFRNPSLAPAFTTLYHGTYEGVSTPTVDGQSIVDTFLVERIVALNVFGCPVSSLDSHNERCGRLSLLHGRSGDEKAHHSCGIWRHASYINHSCMSNARRAFIGNMMIVRASRDLEAGTEITFWYHSPDANSVKDLDKKLKHWGFTCRCALCLDARATDMNVFQKRQRLIGSLKREFEKSALPIKSAESIEHLLDALNQTYKKPAETVPRLLIWDPQLALTRLYAMKHKAGKTVESAAKVLTSLGFVVVGADSSQTCFAIVKWGLLVDHLVEAFEHLETAFAAMGALEDSERAKKCAKTTYRILVGEDESFQKTYSQTEKKIVEWKNPVGGS